MPEIMGPKFVSNPKQAFANSNKKRLIALLIILIALPATVVLALTQQSFMNRASGPEIAKVEVSPGAITPKVGGGTVHLSALAYNSSNIPVEGNVQYSWSMSSSNTVGTLSSTNGNVTEFTPLNYGCGQLTVSASYNGVVTKSISVAVSDGVNIPDCGGPPPDTTPPTIINPRAINITDTKATIVWETDEPASGHLDWGLTDSYGKPSGEMSSYLVDWMHNISGLTPDSIYHFRITSTDAAGNQSVSNDYTFRTLTSSGPTPPPPTQDVDLYAYNAFLTHRDCDLGTLVFVENKGTTSTGDWFLINVNGLKKNVAPLNAGQKLTYWFPENSGPDLKVIVDDGNKIEETNENNNEFSRFVPIPSPPPNCTPSITPTATPVPQVLKTSVFATADAFVRGGRANKNYGTKTFLATHKGKKMISYMKFDLRSMQGKEIKKATLKLRVLWRSKSKWAPSKNTQNLKLVGNSWTERGITFNNKPNPGSPITTFKGNSYGKVLTLDVTNEVIQKNGGYVSFSINSDGNDMMAIYSRESNNNRPSIEIEYF